jgi:deoxyhypusine synthase
MKFQNFLYNLQEKNILSSSELLYEIGSLLNDENSFLYQSSKNNIPIYCPSIADSSLGFQLFMFQQKHPDFIIDTIKDMERITLDLSFDEKKGFISLGGGVSKHYAMFSALLSGGFDYAVYMTTSHLALVLYLEQQLKKQKSWGK